MAVGCTVMRASFGVEVLSVEILIHPCRFFNTEIATFGSPCPNSPFPYSSAARCKLPV